MPKPNGEKNPQFSFADEPAPAETVTQKPTEVLLEWLVKRWPKPNITLRDIHRSAPRAIRDKKTILSLTDTLVEQGWLVHSPTWRHDRREWKIARGLPLK